MTPGVVLVRPTYVTGPALLLKPDTSWLALTHSPLRLLSFRPLASWVEYTSCYVPLPPPDPLIFVCMLDGPSHGASRHTFNVVHTRLLSVPSASFKTNPPFSVSRWVSPRARIWLPYQPQFTPPDPLHFRKSNYCVACTRLRVKPSDKEEGGAHAASDDSLAEGAGA